MHRWSRTLARSAAAGDDVMTVTAVTVATVAVPVTNDAGVKASAAAANAAARRNDDRYDMTVSFGGISA
jgi:hypothetical protein